MPALQQSPVKMFDAFVPFLVVLIFAAVFGSFFYYIIQPELQHYLPGGPNNYASIKELLDGRTAYRNDLDGLATFVQQAAENKQDPIALVLPSGEDVPTLYALFEKIAHDVGVGLQVIDISQGQTRGTALTGPIRSVTINLRFVSVDYATLKRLIAALETNIRLTTIKSLSYDPLNKIANVTVLTYYFGEAQ